jgi:hypothetical protein
MLGDASQRARGTMAGTDTVTGGTSQAQVANKSPHPVGWGDSSCVTSRAVLGFLAGATSGQAESSNPESSPAT